MELPDITLRGAATTAAYLLFGAIGTASLALGLLFALQGVQPAVYHAVYDALAPSGATEFATLFHFVLAGSTAIAATALTAEYASTRGENAGAFARATGAMALLVVAYAAVALVGVDPFGVALAWAAAVAGAVPLLLWVGFDVRSGGFVAFLGGVPVLVLLLVLAGVGIGWGWGYVLVAEEVPESSVGDADVASFASVPQVRDDLFSGDCSGTGGGREVCYLQLRGYEHEAAAAGFLAEHGVRCPFQGSAEDAGSFVAEHDGTYYRVSCGSHGD